MGNRHLVADSIINKLGGDSEVKHAVGMPFTVVAEVNGTFGRRECLPTYFNCPACLSKSMCTGGIENTAQNAVDIAKPPAGVSAMAR
ncbi:hypothetical protein NFJ02_26g59830 [Pycnococcus provasolii]